MAEKKTQLELCGLWERKDRNGNSFYVGSINGLSVMIFKNSYKEKETQPDFKVYLVEKDREQRAPKSQNDDEQLPF